MALFIDGICQREKNKNDIGTFAGGSWLKDWNDPCTKASAAAEVTLRRSSASLRSSPIIFILSIRMVFEHIFELKSYEYDDFNDEKNGFDNGSELEYELKYESECDALSSPTNKSIGALSFTCTSAFGATHSTGDSSCQANVIGHDLVAVLPATTAVTIQIKNCDIDSIWGHTQAVLPSTAIPKHINRYNTLPPLPLIFVLFGIIVFILCEIIFSEYVFNVDLCEVFKENVYKIENANVNGDLCNAYYQPSYPTPAPPPTLIICNAIDIGLCENNILECVFNVDCNGKGSEYDLNIVCEYDSNVLFNKPLCPPPTKYPTSAPPAPRIDFNNSRTGLREQPILQDEIDIVYGGNVIVNDSNNVSEGFNENFYFNRYEFGFLYFDFNFAKLRIFFLGRDRKIKRIIE